MVQLMLEGFGGDWRKRLKLEETTHRAGDEHGIQCFHVNARVSNDLQDVGGVRIGKIARLLWYCAQAIGCRFRYGIDTFYYVPAPAKRSAILRDWIVMLLVRPWFKRTVLHWHAFGLGHWVAGKTEYPLGSDGIALPPPRLFGRLESLAKAITRVLYRNVDLSIVLTQYNRCDAELFNPRRIEIVPNGIPDPCPDFETVLAQRQTRNANRAKNDPVYALFLGHCMEEKGLLDAVRICASGRRTRPVRLIVAGKFPSDAEKFAFENLVDELAIRESVELTGFVAGEAKRELLTRADVLLFPTRYPAETFGLVVVEALAFGLPTITSPWRGVPELSGRVASSVQAEGPQRYALAMETAFASNEFAQLRSRFLSHYVLTQHLLAVAKALRP